MLYSSKKESHTSAEHTALERDERGDPEDEVEGMVSSPTEPEQKKLDPLESLDEPTRICFLVSSGAVRKPRGGFSWARTECLPPCESASV